MVQLICSYLFDEKPHLNSLYWRRGDRTEEWWTLDEIDGRRMPDVPVFVLTSERTFSAAEEFTYNLQTRKRATIAISPNSLSILSLYVVLEFSTLRQLGPQALQIIA